MYKRIALVVLDGVGIGKRDKGDMVYNAYTPRIIQSYPFFTFSIGIGYAVEDAVDWFLPPTAQTVLSRLQPQPLCLNVNQLDTA